MDASSVVPKSSELTSLRKALQNGLGDHNKELVQLVSTIDPPLEGLIRLLRVELTQTRRVHELTTHELEQAPLAYRPAVADYFERISKDYRSATTEKAGVK